LPLHKNKISAPKLLILNAPTHKFRKKWRFAVELGRTISTRMDAVSPMPMP